MAAREMQEDVAGNGRGPGLTIELRRAVRSDSLMLLAWRNDPLSRKNSINTDKITVEQHNRWMDRVFSYPELTEIYIGEHENIPVGVIRFDYATDPIGDEQIFVGIIVAPEMRGHGYGRLLLEAGCLLKRNHQLYATIKVGNAPSIKLFTAMGFAEVWEGEQTLVLSRGPLLL